MIRFVLEDEAIDLLSDNRDTRVMMNCNPAGAPTVEELTRVGPQPSVRVAPV